MPVTKKVNFCWMLPLLAWASFASAQAPVPHPGVLHEADRAFRARQRVLSSADGRHDTLAEYARKCDAATGITVPAFDCMSGVEVPGQGAQPAGTGGKCDNPNVLNGECDPGSRFQVLPGGNADAVAVAHCRKDGQPKENHLFDDIAVIQYNKKNGAVCFYQALENLPGRVPAPRDGEGAWAPNAPPSERGAWFTPQRTEGIGCTGCHDSGGFVRSRYLAALTRPPHVLPNRATGFNNLDTPLKFVGLDFTTNRTWSIDAPHASTDGGMPCNSCHRLAVSNSQRNAHAPRGTAARMAIIATAPEQSSKNPHGASSPIWMRPGQVHFDAGAAASAKIYSDCAIGFINSNYSVAPPGCAIKPLGEPWVDPPVAQPDWSLAPIYYLLLSR